jgi:2-methylisocitrate lyase-like PEP mutase family enzyme
MVDAVPVPISYNRTGVSPMLGLADLERLGERMAANATGAFKASTRALVDYAVDYAKDADQPVPGDNLDRFLT